MIYPPLYLSIFTLYRIFHWVSIFDFPSLHFTTRHSMLKYMRYLVVKSIATVFKRKFCYLLDTTVSPLGRANFLSISICNFSDALLKPMTSLILSFIFLPALIIYS